MDSQSTNQIAKDQASKLRVSLSTLEKQVMELCDFVKETEFVIPANKNEMIANIMIAYRAVEDARMRLGKVLQAADGGTSIYDK